MATTTRTQREALQHVAQVLAEAFALIDSRYWATRDQRKAYEDVLRHLENWIGFES